MTLIKFQQPTKRFFESKAMFPSINGVLDNLLKMDYSWGENTAAVNVSENETSYRLEYLVPGFKKDEIKISLENNVLTVNAETSTESTEEEKRFTRKEYSFNSFKRSFSMPENADVDHLTAKHEHGILNITIPKRIEEKKNNVKEITIE